MDIMGVLTSVWDESFPPKSKFNVEDIPDLTGKVVIVTGANTGLGKETAKALLAHNAKVYIAARNQEKAEQAIKDLKAQTGKDAFFLKLDLSDLPSIKLSAEEFMSKEKDLHILFNNAGTLVSSIGDVTAQNYDLIFGTNTLGPFYFTNLLLPALLAGAKTSADGKARVVNTSSSVSMLVTGINFNTLKDGPARRKKRPMTQYSQSKFGNILFSNELARRYGDQGIVSTSLNPGNLKTDMPHNLPRMLRFIFGYIAHDIPYGALTQLYAGTMPEGLELNGKYLIPWARVGKPNPASNNTKLAQEMWTWMEEQVKDI